MANEKLPEIKYGDFDRTWEKYGILSAPIITSNGGIGGNVKKQYKAILKDDEIVAIVSPHYQVLPNEIALEMTDSIAKKAGFEKPDVYYSKDGNYMCATYLNSKKYRFNINQKKQNILGNKKVEANLTDEVYFGIVMRNSINGTSGFNFGANARKGGSFNFGLYSYRQYCSNGAMAWRLMENSGQNIERTEVAEAIKINQRHYGASLDDFLMTAQNATQKANSQIRVMAEMYKRWTFEFYNESIVEKIAKFLPKKYLPDYINLDEGKVTLEQNGTVWELFNDITDPIWHNTNTDIRTKSTLTSNLHRVLESMEVASPLTSPL
jgi:hypothetical protein